MANESEHGHLAKDLSPKRLELLVKLAKERRESRTNIEDSHSNREEQISYSVKPVSRDALLPISFAQQWFWFLTQRSGRNVIHSVPVVMHLKGKLNYEALELAFSEIIRRHEILRTTFVSLNDQPIQHILPIFPFTLPILDLTILPTEDQATKIKHLISQEMGKPFDLENGPLFRIILLKTTSNETEHILVIHAHHIIFDGWSIGILNHELGTLYTAFANNLSSPLPDLHIQYADFTILQHDWLRGPALEKLLIYWKQELTDAPAFLELPTDRPRPIVQTFIGSTCSFIIDAELTHALKLISRRENATLFMTLYTAFAILISRYSGQNDIVIGSMIANRNHKEVEPLLGLFANPLALRTNLSGNPTFKDLLNKVRRTTLDAYKHQDMPFEKLVEDLHLVRSSSYSPLFQVMFILQNSPKGLLNMQGIISSVIPQEWMTSDYDLTLYIHTDENEQVLSGTVEYNTDLFDRTTIQRMIGHFKTLLEGIVSNREQKVSELPMLTVSEQ